LFSLGSDLFSLLIFFSLQILSPKTIFSQQPLNPPITSKISQKNSIKSGISGCVGSIFFNSDAGRRSGESERLGLATKIIVIWPIDKSF